MDFTLRIKMTNRNSFVHFPGSFKPPKVLLPKREHFARSRDRVRLCILLGSGAVKSKADNALKEVYLAYYTYAFSNDEIDTIDVLRKD